jgi:hypothetical protein
VNGIGMSWQRVCLPLKSHVVVIDVDDQDVVCYRYRVVLAMALLSSVGDGAAEATWL